MECIWIAWPHSRDTWPGRFQRVPPAFVRFIRNIAEVLPVRLLVPAKCREESAQWLSNISNITPFEIGTNDCWVRDYGPTFVQKRSDGSIHGVDWNYNAWGGKYSPWSLDAAAAQAICSAAKIPCLASRLTTEGGALESDGQGRLLTTTDCLVTESRNSGWSQKDIARELHQFLGVEEILWLDEVGLEGDDTDGHIDQLARFTDPQNVVVAACNEKSDPNYEPLQRLYRQLYVWGRQTSPQVEIHRLQIPPRRTIDGQRVPESYCNFLMLSDKRILFPQFRAPETDRVALGIMRNLLPNYEVLPVDAADLAWGLGAFHCASQQQPAAAR